MLSLRSFMLRTKLLFLAIACIGVSAWADKYADQVYSKIKDIRHPTLKDYKRIQKYLSKGERPFIDRLDGWQYKGKAREFRFIGRNPEESIESGIIPVHCDSGERENCIVLYCSFNHEYPKCLKQLIERIRNSSFKGHILYHVGGWPDVEGKALKFAHIPFAFKLCSFREAQRLGYKRALWLDAAIVPLIDLNDVFSVIGQNGCFTFAIDDTLSTLCNKKACRAMGVDFRQAHLIHGVLAGILGFDFQQPLAQEAIKRWYDITKYHEEAYFSPRGELCVISVIFYQLGLTHHPNVLGKVTWEKEEIQQPGLEFFVDKYAVQPNWPN